MNNESAWECVVMDSTETKPITNARDIVIMWKVGVTFDLRWMEIFDVFHPQL